MTTQETEQVDPPRSRPHGAGTASTKAAGKAYQRRMRRQELVLGHRLTRTGSPIAATLNRVPFLALVLLLLAGGVVGVLYLNTMTDAAGLRASQSRLAQTDLDTKIEAANKDIAAMKDPALLAAQAKALGLVPPGDAAMIQIDANGRVTIIGTPAPAVAPAPTLAVTAPATPTPAAPPTTTATAVVTTAAKTTAPKTTPVKTTAPKTTAAKATAPKTTPVKAAAPNSAIPKSATPKTTAPTNNGAGH